MAKRKSIATLYDQLLDDIPVQRPVAIDATEYNYSYHPIIVDSEKRLLQIRDLLLQNNISTRRYFFPSLNNLPQYRGEACPVSESVSIRSLALPMYYELEETTVKKICELIKTCF